MHTLEMMPDCVASGPTARRAWQTWTEAAKVAERGRRRLKAVPAIESLVARGTYMMRPPAMGEAVWARARLLREAGCEWLRAQVIGADRLSGRWLVANIDEPRCQWYAAATDLQPRYRGEIAPGITADSKRGSRGSTAINPGSITGNGLAPFGGAA